MFCYALKRLFSRKVTDTLLGLNEYVRVLPVKEDRDLFDLLGAICVWSD